MRDNKNYLSKNMFYNINVTIVLQFIGSYTLFFKRKLLITRFARHNLSKLSSALTCTAIPNSSLLTPNYIPYSSKK